MTGLWAGSVPPLLSFTNLHCRGCCGQFLCSGCGHILPDTLWGLDLLLAAASSATSQQFPLFIPCRAGKFFPLCHLSGCHLAASAFVPCSCNTAEISGVGESRELQLPELLLSSLGYLATNSPSSSWSPSSSVPCCPRLVAVNESRHPEQSQLSLLRECTPEQSNSDQGPWPALLPAAENFFLVSWLTAW